MDKAETLDTQLTTILEKLKKLGDGKSEQPQSLEKYVQGQIIALLDAEASIGESINKIYKNKCRDKDYDEIVQLSGSCVEGAMMARCFQRKEGWKEIEMDVMFKGFTVLQKASHLLEPVKGKLGFLRIPYQGVFPGPFRLAELCPKKKTNKYVCPQCLKNVLLDVQISSADSVIKEHLPSLDSVLNMTGMKDDVLSRHFNVECSQSLTETTVERNVSKGSDSIHCSWDMVPSGRLLFWPHEAASWITRPRLWPSQNTIKSITDKGCQVVPRSSPGGDVHSEWRLSFSIPEATLAQLRSKNQQQAYYFVKVFFYQYLKCVKSSDGKSLYSYIVKTTMLWACEELPPEDPIWASLENSAQMLLVKLLGSLETGLLSHYFISEINLLESVGQDVRMKCADIIGRWLNNILMTAPFDVPEKLKYIINTRNVLGLFSLGPEVMDFLFVKDFIDSLLRNQFPSKS